jgi:2-polyprenyl-6-methoxyphenol hydroxylase-like FAD-dependent oxidoreductase
MNRTSTGPIKTVAIIGGGPVASTLATLLARAGIKVGLWHKPKAVPLMVGESLVPAIIPMLRKLGVEDIGSAKGSRKNMPPAGQP